MADLDKEPQPKRARHSSNCSDAQETVCAFDLIDEEKSLEECANAVLGPSDDKNCSYDKGYVSRQALYSCITCRQDPSSTDSRAGICLACSITCHADHELVELYTKRNFRCDCGNKKFKSTKCKLKPGKEVENENNSYNQNFDGLYCTCHRPYPDIHEDELDNDEMIQCVVCEDWFHSLHLCSSDSKTVVPENEDYEEMICHLCVSSPISGILSPYTSYFSQIEPEITLNFKSSETEHTCVLKRLKEQYTGAKNDAKPAFLPINWREKLCKCQDCLVLYEQHSLSFLLDLKDTITWYESQQSESFNASTNPTEGEEDAESRSSSSSYERGMAALSSMDPSVQLEMISGYNTMKDELLEYLKQFADSNKVVKKDDITDFFKQLNAKRSAPNLPPSSCK